MFCDEEKCVTTERECIWTEIQQKDSALDTQTAFTVDYAIGDDSIPYQCVSRDLEVAASYTGHWHHDRHQEPESSHTLWLRVSSLKCQRLSAI